MLHISLFSGIGGFDIASEWMGWTNIVSCEINPFGRKHLEYYWPEAYHHDDIHTLTYEKINEELTKRFGSNWRTNDIILTGGFPCQPYSTAGKRLGKNDERHLWPQMLRVIQEVAPTYIVGENVRGIVNWNGGMVFDEVQADLEDAGYEVIPFIIPACAVNAPHRRDRVWFVAHSTSGNDRGRPGEFSQQNEQQEKERPKKRIPKLVCSSEAHDASNTNNQGLEGSANGRGVRKRGQKPNEQSSRRIYTTWQNFPTQPPVRFGNDGFQPRLDSITFSKWRNESIKAAGNAIVPQVAYQIFKAIQFTHDNL
jgi:DNA (cytosine-5)-methyltransferase 1